MTGLIGFSSGYHAMMSCDTLLLLGCDFPYRPFYPAHAKIIQVDWKGSRLGRRAPLALGLVGTVKEHRRRDTAKRCNAKRIAVSSTTRAGITRPHAGSGRSGDAGGALDGRSIRSIWRR